MFSAISNYFFGAKSDAAAADAADAAVNAAAVVSNDATPAKTTFVDVSSATHNNIATPVIDDIAENFAMDAKMPISDINTRVFLETTSMKTSVCKNDTDLEMKPRESSEVNFATLEAYGFFECAELDRKRTFSTPDDPFLPCKWAMEALCNSIGKPTAMEMIKKRIYDQNGHQFAQLDHSQENLGLLAKKLRIGVTIRNSELSNDFQTAIDTLYTRLFALIFGVNGFFDIRNEYCAASLAKNAALACESYTDEPLSSIPEKDEQQNTAAIASIYAKNRSLYNNKELSIAEMRLVATRSNILLKAQKKAAPKEIKTIMVDVNNTIAVGGLSLLSTRQIIEYVYSQVLIFNQNKEPIFTVQRIYGARRARLYAENAKLQAEMILPTCYRISDAREKLYAAIYAHCEGDLD